METGAIYKKHFDCVYFLKNVHAAIASNMMAMTHRDELLIPVFLAMRTILCQECIFVSTISTGRNRSVIGHRVLVFSPSFEPGTTVCWVSNIYQTLNQADLDHWFRRGKF
jgi:hypothetical protein